VNVGGSVRQPNRIPFTEDLTLLSAINASGGFNDFADQKRVRLLRGSEVTIYDVRQFRKDPSKDVKLQPGDRIEVPQTFF
jgi:protein involved in polysaccharide export with SLBB domain